MARNQPFDFSDDDDLASGSATLGDAEFSESGSADMIGVTDDITGEAGITQTGAQAGMAAETAAQRTQTATRSATGQHDTPTSMQDKRGNQPR